MVEHWIENPCVGGSNPPQDKQLTSFIYFMNSTTINFLITLKNYSILKKEYLKYEYSKNILEITKCLYEEGFIQSFRILNSDNKIFILILLRFFFNKPILKQLKIISTPSRKKYLSFKDLSKFSNKKYVFFISTSKGLLTLEECKKTALGGVLFFVC